MALDPNDIVDRTRHTLRRRGATNLPASRPAAQLAAKTWEPTLTVIGADGLPPVHDAGNVLRPSTTLALSFRLPLTPPSHPAERRLRSNRRCPTGRAGAAYDADEPPFPENWHGRPRAP